MKIAIRKMTKEKWFLVGNLQIVIYCKNGYNVIGLKSIIKFKKMRY